MNTNALANEATPPPGHAELAATDPLMEMAQAAAGESAPRGNSFQPRVASYDFIRFYGLRENPFSDAVNPGYFYKTESHVEALQRMNLAVHHNVSLGMVTGLSGTGKTLVSQLLLQQLDSQKCQGILVLVSPGLGRTGLLNEILSELSVGLPAGVQRTQDLLRLLSNYIIDLHHNGQRLVIIIDECHLLSAECLHVVRTISNVEVPERKLTTCLLFGEERFARRLEHPSFAAMRNRMYMCSELRPMSVEDCAQYVKFRLMIAGRMDDLFDDAALVALHAHSGGICRTLNKLCMLTLLEAAMHGRATVDESLVLRGAARM